MNNAFTDYLNSEDQILREKSLERPFILDLDNVQITRGKDGRYVAVINGQIYPATTDGESGLSNGVYHFDI